MPLSNGCNHVTVVTPDLERLIAFYGAILDAEARFVHEDDGLRHAMIDLGGGFSVHAFQLNQDNPHATGLPSIFARGHIDHLAVNLPDRVSFEEARRRLVEQGACGGRVRDFGSIEIVAFEDPDGMECEIALEKSGKLRTMAESTVREFEPA